MKDRSQMTRSEKLRTQISDYRSFTRENLLTRDRTGGPLAPDTSVLRWLGFVAGIVYLGTVIA